MYKQALNYKFRIYPNQLYKSRLESNLESCRFLYNYFIEHRYDNEYDMNYTLVELKEQYNELKNCNSKMLQMVSKQVANVKKALRKLKKNGYTVGKPKIKRKDEYNSFTYNQSGFKLVNREGRWYLWLSKIGYIRIKLHRQLDYNIKQVVIKRKSNKWHAILAIEKTHPIFKFINPKSRIAIDLNAKDNFIVDSNNKIKKPDEPKRLIRRLKLIQRKLSRRQKGSNNYKKAKRWYQIIHERIMSKRLDYIHKVSREYSNKYDIIVAEDLRVKNMLNNKPLNTNKQNNTLHRNIQGSNFSRFINMLRYKTKLLILVNSKDTSQVCYNCNNIVKKELKDRVHKCPYCNINIDIDYNSALNILKLGLNYLPTEYGEVTPVETIRSMKREAYIGISNNE